ncbi:hypothetical protein MCG45_16415 [Clostridium perfringens]|uniref:hypothetical protein n=1 Tax=Clostridium perfringens TaxID=1502 RepID=UPI001F06B152|nr:hypothetical protein [Clostridium perfringens]MCH1964415.1 hypothetical protein [Clostridium perfringens]
MMTQGLILILGLYSLIALFENLDGVAFQYKNDKKDIDFTIKNSAIILPILVGLAILLINIFLK